MEKLRRKGNAFETFLECRNATQYEETVKALQIFASNKFRNGGDIGWMLKNEEEFNFSKPIKPNPPKQEDEDIHKERVKIFVSRKDRYEENKEWEISIHTFVAYECSLLISTLGSF